ncbi:hypothetical protein WICMUC_000292 [Wickerhamomyces mucosus]|uniref:Chromatin modification-related protein EAF3 n=1 Tax=Wickerhamomyces mucosus TaxID=1378264 RepID=A0A9P8Q0C5_9ASCO|nr:hypothetical protein WICMUC_000292 [Wickerhamomyces mucosus]
MNSNYIVNGKCLAFHGPLLYEAKILKIHRANSNIIETKDGEISLDSNGSIIPKDLFDINSYFIHYKGWKSSWDEWVDDLRLKEINDENLQLQKNLKFQILPKRQQQEKVQQQQQQVQQHPQPPTSSSSTSSSKSNKKKSEKDLDQRKKHQSQEINIIIPDILKSYLVDDWEKITKDHQLIKIPLNPSINYILQKFEIELYNGYNQLEILKEFLIGLKLYFNKSLPNLLLYRFERFQFLEIYQNLIAKDEDQDLDYTEIYGGFHLLRLLVIFPSLLTNVTMDLQSVSTLKNLIELLIQYLNDNKSWIFDFNFYENCPPSYEFESKSV